jgi:hypothetical protein
MFVRQRKTFDWVAMQAYIDEGNGFLKCRERFGIAHATWKKAIAAGDIVVDASEKRFADVRKRYDWAEVQAYYDSVVHRSLRLFDRFMVEGREGKADPLKTKDGLDGGGGPCQIALADYH